MDTEELHFDDILEINTNNCVFDDFFNVDEIQKIQDNVTEALDIASIITSPDGTPITKASHFCTFCEHIMRSNEVAIQNCINSDATLGRPSDKPIIRHCLSGGLLDAGVSFVVGGKHVASWMLGQIRDESIELSVEKITNCAQNLNIPVDVYTSAINEVPFLPRDKFEKIVNLIHIIVRQLCDIAYKNYVLNEELKYQRSLEKKLLNEHDKLLHMSRYDELTGVYNRNYFNTILNNYESKRTLHLGIIMGDVNNLKLANDIFGHIAGDRLLKTVSNILIECSDDKYVIGRCGGDEFNIIVPDATEKELHDFCTNVSEKCRNFKGLDFTPSVSLGYCIRMSEAQSINAVMDYAEIKMYKAKEKIKLNQNILSEIENTLYKNGFLSPELIQSNIRISNNFGKFLSLSTDNIDKLELLTHVKDFGMVGFSQIEFESWDEADNMCSSLERGYRLAKLIPKTNCIADSLYQTHEWWNGMGIPQHKSGDDITLLARLASIITYYTQAVSSPPYGLNMSEEKAKKKLKRYAGTRFDPIYTDKFLEFLEKCASI